MRSYTKDTIETRRIMLFDKDSVIISEAGEDTIDGRVFICRWPKEIRPLGTRNNMIVSYPPVQQLVLTNTTNDDQALVGRGRRPGVTHGQLVRGSNMLWSKDPYLRKKKAVAHRLPGTTE